MNLDGNMTESFIFHAFLVILDDVLSFELKIQQYLIFRRAKTR
jgi:hypothetical protein